MGARILVSTAAAELFPILSRKLPLAQPVSLPKLPTILPFTNLLVIVENGISVGDDKTRQHKPSVGLGHK